jgi:L-Ala-D/L-Glu epimerase
MRIEGLEATPISLPFRQRYRTAAGQLDGRSMVIVRIRSASDHFGLGEAVPLTLRGGPGLERILAELERVCAPALAGADLSPVLSANRNAVRGLVWGLLERCRGQGAGAQAIAAIDIALHDLAGRISGLPAWQLLGAESAREVRCNASLDAGEPAETAERAGEAARRGFTCFKVKVGAGDDEGRVAAVRRSAGPEARIRVDANGAWAREPAVARIEGLAEVGLELVEQPSPTLEDLASIRSRVAVPIVADESVAGAEDADRAAASGACDAATLKLAKVGGPLEALRIASVIPSYLSSALDGPIGIAAALHAAQALPRGGLTDGLAHGLATLDMFAASYARTDGLVGPALIPPPGPGIGVVVDDVALNELRIG